MLEEVGLTLERDKEKDFREEKQLGVFAEWTMEGRLYNLPLPSPFKGRPRKGCRHLIQSRLSNIIHPIYREIKDNLNLENKLKGTQLLK